MVDTSIKMVKSHFNAPDNISLDSEDGAVGTFYDNCLALMKLRENYACRVSKVSQGIFKCILEYCEPSMIKRVEQHYKYNPEYPINFIWPEKVSYLNPIRGVKLFGITGWLFELESGEMTDIDRRPDEYYVK